MLIDLNEDLHVGSIRALLLVACDKGHNEIVDFYAMPNEAVNE